MTRYCSWDRFVVGWFASGQAAASPGVKEQGPIRLVSPDAGRDTAASTGLGAVLAACLRTVLVAKMLDRRALDCPAAPILGLPVLASADAVSTLTARNWVTNQPWLLPSSGFTASLWGGITELISYDSRAIISARLTKDVLVSDFYGAYDSLNCPQEKCLIHLIQDMNDDLLNEPFNEELKGLVGEFAGLLGPMIENVVGPTSSASGIVRDHRGIPYYTQVFGRSR